MRPMLMFPPIDAAPATGRGRRVASASVLVAAGPLTARALILAAAVLAGTLPAIAREDGERAAAGDIAGRAPSSAHAERTSFVPDGASVDAHQIVDWILASGDNKSLPFVVIDKVQAQVLVFNAAGGLMGASRALLGRTIGDESSPGVGGQALSTIRPDQRTTPAGRFVAVMGHDLKTDVLWIDYDTSLSLHRVVTGNPGDRRMQRLATTSTYDKRISYGCVNVPARFYDDVVVKAFSGTRGIVYILPEVKKIGDVFSFSIVKTPGIR